MKTLKLTLSAQSDRFDRRQVVLLPCVILQKEPHTLSMGLVWLSRLYEFGLHWSFGTGKAAKTKNEAATGAQSDNNVKSC